ncbi:MAG: hypothetical protein SF066_03545 [Thermoanaerobaculia bacterium]|nr:hypothetical protein [Thermoanaerobaculia bacterium]
MPIQPDPAPHAASTEAVRKHLAAEFALVVPPTLSGLSTERLASSDGYQVDFLGLDDLAAGELTRRGRSQLWRHLLFDGDDAVAEVDLDGDGPNLQAVAIHRGPRAAGTAVGLRVAHEASGEETRTFRLVECPALRFAAIRLDGKNGPGFVVIEPDQTGLPKNKLLSADEVNEALRELATQAVEAFRAAQGPIGA